MEEEKADLLDERMDFADLDLAADGSLDAMDIGFDEFLRQLDDEVRPERLPRCPDRQAQRVRVAKPNACASAVQGGGMKRLVCGDDFALDALLGDDLFEAQLANVPELRISSGADGDGGLSPLLSPADSAARCRAASPQASAGSAAPHPDVSGSGASSAKATSSCEAALDATAQVRSRADRAALASRLRFGAFVAPTRA